MVTWTIEARTERKVSKIQNPKSQIPTGLRCVEFVTKACTLKSLAVNAGSNPVSASMNEIKDILKDYMSERQIEIAMPRILAAIKSNDNFICSMASEKRCEQQCYSCYIDQKHDEFKGNNYSIKVPKEMILEEGEYYRINNTNKVLYWNGTEWMNPVKDAQKRLGTYVAKLDKQPLIKSVEAVTPKDLFFNGN